MSSGIGAATFNILCAGWERAETRSFPFTWCVTGPGEFISESDSALLADTFPSSGFVRINKSHRDSEEKTYRNWSRPVAPDVGLPAPWQRLIEDLSSTRYREAVGAALGQRAASQVEIRLVRHESGDWLAPHTDRADKLFSHVLYLNHEWHAEWGGCLEILESRDPGSAVQTIVPALGVSALLSRCDNSWHQVTKVVSQAAGERRSVLVHGIK
jgi:SM-20-related protein